MEIGSQKINLATVASQNLKERDFWKNILSGNIYINGFFYDKINSNKLKDNYRNYLSTIENDFFLKLLKVSNNSDSRLFIILTTSLFGLLYKYTDKEDIILATTIHKQIEDLNLINKHLILRSSINEKTSFKSLLLETRKNFIECIEHQNFPLEVFQNEFSNLDIAIILNNIHKEEYLDLINPKILFIFSLNENSLDFKIKYNESYYHDDTIVNIANHYLVFLEMCLANIDQEISCFDLITDKERKQLLQEFNNTQDNTFVSKTIIELFEEQVKKTSNDIALFYDDNTLTYNELNILSNQLARYIYKLGFVEGSVIGLIVDRSFELVISIIAIMKARMAYLPIAPNTPIERIHYLLLNSSAKLLIYHEKYSAICENENLFIIDKIVLEKDNWKNEIETNLNLIYNKTDLAYVLYTSGSTGKPKGVLIEQQNIINTLQWFGKTYDIKKNKNIIQLTNYTFDPSIEQLFGALLNGGQLFIPINEILSDYKALRKYIKDNNINIINFTPRFLYELLCDGEKIESLKIVISGGEKLEESIKNTILEKGYDLFNHYGPTEVTIDALQDKCSNTDVSLGKPITNTKVFVLDKHLNIKPIGVPGKLYISGTGVANGYLNNIELTSKKFIQSPFDSDDYLYDTGDIARWHSDGKIEFIGREDNQIKIRGYRIEIEEIESVLLEMENIKDAVVVVVESNDDKYLTAFIVSDKKMNVESIRFNTSQKLPHYMTPVSITQVEEIPRNHNGKIDRKKIQGSDVFKRYLVKTYKAPETDLEKKISNIWKEILSLEKVGVNENFFELGGNSMNIIQLSNMVNDVLSINITVVNIFDNPTIHSLSVFLEGRNSFTNEENNDLENSTGRMKKSIQRMKGILNG